MIDIAKIVTTSSEGAYYDQPCRFGCRAGDHAVYCESERAGMPRKCRRTWYTGGAIRDQDCPGYEPNPEYREEAASSSISDAMARISEILQNLTGENPVVTCSDICSVLSTGPTWAADAAECLPAIGRLCGYPVLVLRDKLIVFVICQYCGAIGGGITSSLTCAECGAPI